MDYRRRVALAGQGGLELEQAAGVAGGYYLGVERGDELGFTIAESVGGVGLDEIVDACGAAADGGFWNFGEFNAGDVCEQLAGLAANTLRVLEMAGIVERYAHAQGISRGARREFGENFGDVFALCGEGFGAIGIVGIVAKQMSVFLYVGAAPCGVSDNGVDIGTLEDVDGFSGKIQCATFFSCVNH